MVEEKNSLKVDLKISIEICTLTVKECRVIIEVSKASAVDIPDGSDGVMSYRVQDEAPQCAESIN